MGCLNRLIHQPTAQSRGKPTAQLNQIGKLSCVILWQKCIGYRLFWKQHGSHNSSLAPAFRDCRSLVQIDSMNHQYFLGISDMFLPFISIRLRSSVMPFSILFMLLLTQQQPAKGAEMTTPTRIFLTHRQYFSGMAMSLLLFNYFSRQPNYYPAHPEGQEPTFTGPLLPLLLAVHLENNCSFRVIIFALFQRHPRGMKNNFVPAFPFHKKEHEASNRTAPGFLSKNAHPSLENTDKKISTQPDAEDYESDLPFPGKQIQTTEEESINSEQPSSCKSSQITTKPSKKQQKLIRGQRIISPNKYDTRSPYNKPANSPNIKESRLGSNHFVPIRATLKNLIQSKVSPPNKNEQNYLSPGAHSNREIQLNSSIKVNRALAEMYQSPLKNIEKENQILREENDMLKRELSEIKKNLMFGTSNKKEEIISTLRNTIKKEDSENKELRLKLEIFTKKNAALATLVENKEEETAFLANKIKQIELELQELRDHKVKSGEKLEKLKERINYMLKSYNQLESKWNKSEMDWLNFQEKWMEEKGIYLHRISFLEEYIANN